MAVNVKSLKRNAFPFLSGTIIGAGYMLLENKYPAKTLQTNPDLPLKYKIADRFLEKLFMRFLDVYSHHWHWNNMPYNEKFNDFGVLLQGAPSGNPHNNPFFGVIAHLGGRPYGHVVEAERQDKEKPYRIAFKHPWSNHFRICSIEVNEPVMLLTGPDEGCIAFAIDKNGTPLKLNDLSGLIHRKDKPAGVRIL
jgi:hypothetical protein